MALLQAAIDTLDFKQTINIIRKISKYVDIVELGTPCIKYNGMTIVYAVRDVLQSHPNVKILADLKTMDAGEYEAAPFFEAGASIVTVLGAADEGTIAGVVKASKIGINKQTQVDLLNVSNKVERAWDASRLGANIVGIHTGLDQQASGKTPFEDLNSIVKDGPKGLQISVAGGINKDTISQVIDSGAHIVVVGAAIYGSDDPAKEAFILREIITKNG